MDRKAGLQRSQPKIATVQPQRQSRHSSHSLQDQLEEHYQNAGKSLRYTFLYHTTYQDRYITTIVRTQTKHSGTWHCSLLMYELTGSHPCLLLPEEAPSADECNRILQTLQACAHRMVFVQCLPENINWQCCSLKRKKQNIDSIVLEMSPSSKVQQHSLLLHHLKYARHTREIPCNITHFFLNSAAFLLTCFVP